MTIDRHHTRSTCDNLWYLVFIIVRYTTTRNVRPYRVFKNTPKKKKPQRLRSGYCKQREEKHYGSSISMTHTTRV